MSQRVHRFLLCWMSSRQPPARPRRQPPRCHRESPKPLRSFLLLVVTIALAGTTLSAAAAGRGALDADARKAYNSLVAKVPAAKALARSAVAVLVFPKITKAGLVVGGQYGDGVLLKGGKTAGYYNTSGASYGLQGNKITRLAK